jgi:hypothetical protein
MRLKKLLPLSLGLVFLAGCAITITNLTPREQIRNANGLYPFEATLDTTQQTVRKDSIQPSVIMGLESYPMRPTPMLKNRWETLVPIPPDKEYVNYQYKFDYEYHSIPQRKSGSKLSPPYQLHLKDR